MLYISVDYASLNMSIQLKQTDLHFLQTQSLDPSQLLKSNNIRYTWTKNQQ